MDLSQPPLIEFRGVTKVYGSGEAEEPSSPSWDRRVRASRRR